MNEPVKFLNEIIPASAGTGKTYRLTNKFIQLMHQGAKPESIVALTFTKKAAAEFFEEIQKKLANCATDANSAKLIAKDLGYHDLTQEKFLNLLRVFTDAMPRLELGTLDSFLYKIIIQIPFEIGIDNEFELMTDYEILKEREAVYRKVFENSGKSGEEFLVAFKLATFGREDSGILRNLDDYINSLHNIYLYNPEPHYWGNELHIWPSGFNWKVLDKITLKNKTKKLLQLIKENNDKDIIIKKWRTYFDWVLINDSGNPVPSDLRTLHNNLLEAKDELNKGNASINVSRNKHYIEGEQADLFLEILSHIVGTQIKAQASRTRGLWKVLQSFEDEYQRTVRKRGRLTFSDLSYFLSSNHSRESFGGLVADLIDKVEYRLDAKYEHWLLDEFQDTSREQWNAIKNLIDEAAQDPEAKRSVFIVGDIKQSIYAWRGGDTQLFREQRAKYRNLGAQRYKETNLNLSRRSSSPVIEMTNSIFGDIDEINTLFPAISNEWEFQNHSTIHDKRLGYATWITPNTKEKNKFEARLEIVSAIINEIDPIKKGIDIGVLVQTKKIGNEVTEYLREHTGIKITNDADIAIATDNPLSIALISIFRCAAHPSDDFSWTHLKMTPFWKKINDRFSNIEEFSQSVRSSVWRNQFAETVKSWISSLEIDLDDFNLMRAEQFYTAACIYDRRGSRSIDDFIRFMESYKLSETGQTGSVQVMTIHKSKGLDFDAVILPEIEGNSFSSLRPGIKMKRNGNHETEWILNMPNKAYVELDDELSDFYSREAKSNTIEEICKFYVALTRARYANYLISDEINEKSRSKNFISLLSKTIKTDDLNSGILYELGQKDWHKKFDLNNDPLNKTNILDTRPIIDEKLRRKPNYYSESKSKSYINKLNSSDIFNGKSN